MNKKSIIKSFVGTLIVSVLFFCTTGASCNRNEGASQKAATAIAKTKSGANLKSTTAENAANPTITSWEYTSETVTKKEKSGSNVTTILSNTVSKETYNINQGEHQKDEARAQYGEVKKVEATLASMKPVTWAGIVLIFLAIAMSYFQAKFPNIFTPGLKTIALTMISGLILCVLPSFVDSKTQYILFLATLSVLGAFIVGRRFSKSSDTNK